MNNLAKEINALLLEDQTIKEYINLKKEIDNDKKLSSLYQELDKKRKNLCKKKDTDSKAYYELLELYNSDKRVKKLKSLQKEIQDYLMDVSDILSLK